MNEPILYSQYNNLQKRDANYLVENFMRLIKWRNDGQDNILDIGSGDGDVILNQFLPKFPTNFNRLYCVDACKEMVEYSRKRCFDQRIIFEKMDIEKDEIPKRLCNYFDHVFSCFCINWIQQHDLAWSNIYKLMKPGGDLLVLFLQNCLVFDVYEKMGKSEKWSAYLGEYKQFIPPLHYAKHPENKMEEILKRAGFVSRVCRVEDRTFIFPSWEHVANSFKAVNPFISSLPDHLVDSYVKDYIEEIRKAQSIKIERSNNNDDEQIHFHYKVYIIYATKPTNPQ